MSRYTKTAYVVGNDGTVLRPGNKVPKPVGVKPDLPGAVIAVHGVNDVGTSYDAVEQGLCRGLSERLGYDLGRTPYRPATYRMPRATDRDELEADPDAVFFKRQVETDTHSMVIPFYWGSREASKEAHPGSKTPHGQSTDRYGNRLDADFSKGGGPFANATTTLVDLWNRGASGLGGALDWAAQDPLRPVLAAPGRMYMVLAAKRLAALVSMIRDYEEKETVNIVAHSQGCLVSLLAQAFLLDEGEHRPADTLILTHPPYSLDELSIEAAMQASAKSERSSLRGGIDRRMVPHYDAIEGGQTLGARLDTLVAIVRAVGAKKAAWTADDLKRMRGCGVHTARWAPAKDRDNRGKVYLYFCPEDMTVALDSVQGIGWQGVPHDIEGHAIKSPGQAPGRPAYGHRPAAAFAGMPERVVRHPIEELTQAGLFRQRVFTAKQRLVAGHAGKVPFPVGLPPGDFRLREPGEDDRGHVVADNRTMRSHLPENRNPALDGLHAEEGPGRRGLRLITGEALARPVPADMYAGSVDVGALRGAAEPVDPIDAATAATSAYGARKIWVLMPGKSLHPPMVAGEGQASPAPEVYPHRVRPAPGLLEAAERYVAEQPGGQGRRVEAAYECLDPRTWQPTGQCMVKCLESADEVRLRQQHSTSARSFHGAIFGSARNHAQVTAYDVAVGQGTAVSHPEFYRYLCAVADWRLKNPKFKDRKRPGILEWKVFLKTFSTFWSEEDESRKKLIEGNCTYYSTGELPIDLPLIDKLPAAVRSETMNGNLTGRASLQRETK